MSQESLSPITRGKHRRYRLPTTCSSDGRMWSRPVALSPWNKRHCGHITSSIMTFVCWLYAREPK